MRQARKIGYTIISVAVGCAVFASCSADESATATDTVTTLRIGISYDQPGLSLMADDGVPTGLDVDVAAYIAWKLGHSPYGIEWVNAPYESRLQMLSDGTVDMVVGSYSISDERLEVIDMVGPYLVAGQDVLVRADDTSIGGLDSLTGKLICAAEGTTSLARIESLLGDTAEIISVGHFDECAAMLAAGEIDAMSTGNAILAGYAATEELFGKVRLVGETFSEDQYSIGLPKGSTVLCERINIAIQDMINDGSWQRFLTRHMDGTGYTPNPDLNPPTPRPCR